MKTLALLLSLSLSIAAQAKQVQPDFVCVEESGFTYEFFMTDFSEIHQYDENGNHISDYDGIQFNYKILESFPAIDQYTISYADGGNEIAFIEFAANSNTGSGEMIDHDQKMTCKRF